MAFTPRAAPTFATVTAYAILNHVRRLALVPILVPCPACRSPRGDWCQNADGSGRVNICAERHDLSGQVYAAQAAIPSVRSVKCPIPECEAAPGKMCRWSKGGRLRSAHDARRRVLAEAKDEAAARVIAKAMGG